MSSYQGSQVFYPYRTIGLYASKVPFALRKQGTEHFATVPVENTYQVIAVRILHLCVSDTCSVTN